MLIVAKHFAAHFATPIQTSDKPAAAESKLHSDPYTSHYRTQLLYSLSSRGYTYPASKRIHVCLLSIVTDSCPHSQYTAGICSCLIAKSATCAEVCRQDSSIAPLALKLHCNTCTALQHDSGLPCISTPSNQAITLWHTHTCNFSGIISSLSHGTMDPQRADPASAHSQLLWCHIILTPWNLDPHAADPAFPHPQLHWHHIMLIPWNYGPADPAAIHSQLLWYHTMRIPWNYGPTPSRPCRHALPLL